MEYEIIKDKYSEWIEKLNEGETLVLSNSELNELKGRINETLKCDRSGDGKTCYVKKRMPTFNDNFKGI